MSSPQFPERSLVVTTALCCAFLGCAPTQDLGPAKAGSGDVDPTRATFLSASNDATSESTSALGRDPGPGGPGAAPDAQSIDAILDEILAGHEVLESRKALENEELPAKSEADGSSSASVEVVAVESSQPSDNGSDTNITSTADPVSPLDTEVLAGLPRIEPSTDMIRSLMASAARSDAPLKQHLALAMLMAWVAPEKPFEPAGLGELTEEERSIVSIVYEHFKSLGTELDGGGGEADLLNALTGIITAVEGQSPFQIARMELCSWVRDFGDVDVIEPLTFSPKERPRFIWYVELDGVAPVQNDATGEWAHEFDVKVEVLTRDTGIPVITPIEDRVRYASSSRLRDLFLRNILEIPEDLQFDWYTTKVTVTEVTSGIRSQKSLDLLWVPNLAAGEAHFLRQATAEE